MITAQDILTRQKEEPFTPFKIHLSDGRSIEIQHPENMLVYRNSVVVAFPESGDIPKRGEKYSILHITSLEGLKPIKVQTTTRLQSAARSAPKHSRR